MGKRIDAAGARQEAADYLRLALALLDDAGELKTAVYVATAIDTLSTNPDQFSGSSDITEKTASSVEFTVSWGVLSSQIAPEPEITSGTGAAK